MPGLRRYENSGGPEDDRHRMLVNAAAAVLVVGLIGAGLWLASEMAQIRKNQDCVLSGRRNCAPIDVSHDRW